MTSNLSKFWFCRHQSRLPTPRTSRDSLDVSRVSVNVKKSLNATKFNDITIKPSISNTSIHGINNDGYKKPPIPNNTTQNKSLSQVRDPKQLQLSSAKTDKKDFDISQDRILKTPRINNLIPNNRSASISNKMLITPISAAASQKKKCSLPTDSLKLNVTQDLSKKRLISPSGLLVDGPLNRKSSLSPSRKDDTKKTLLNVSSGPQYNSNTFQMKSSNEISKSNISAIPSPSVIRKQQQTGFTARRSMLPQPMSVLRRPSTSPSR